MKFEQSNIYYLRPEILEFAQAMEVEMQKKDKLGYTNHDRSIEFLIDKLSEERDEVDECLITLSGGKWNINSDKLINEELLHEGIMLALLRYRLKELKNEQKEMDNEIAVQRQYENEKCVNPQEAY